MPAEKKTSATSWFTRIILGLVIVAMAGFGMSQYSVDAAPICWNHAAWLWHFDDGGRGDFW